MRERGLGKPADMVIFADSSVRIGSGHVMRCVALAQSWKRAGGRAEFVVRQESPGLIARIREEGFVVKELAAGRTFRDAIGEQIRSEKFSLAVLDGYGFGSAEQIALENAGIQVLFLDDYGHAEHYPARWVLNHNPYAQAEPYARRNPETRLLLGLEYVLLREEFLPWLSWKPVVSDPPRKILVTMGGSDADNASSKILEALNRFAQTEKKYSFEVILAVGGGNPHLETIERGNNSNAIRLQIVRDARNIPSLMAWADVAIAAAGGTALELCYIGVPSLLFIAAENQRKLAESLDQRGAAVNAGATGQFNAGRFMSQFRALFDSSTRRSLMSERGRSLVDGSGADRVRGALTGRELQLRHARESDCKLLFDWANDPAARAASFHSASIRLEEHRRWFAEKLNNPLSLIYIGEDCSPNVAGQDATAQEAACPRPVGQVRFQLDGNSAVISVGVAPEFRGKGWGATLVSFATRAVARNRLIDRVDAFVKPQNAASIRLFQKTGFDNNGAADMAGQPALRFSWRCERRVYAG